MRKRVNALPNEVQVLDHPLIIKKLELEDPLEKQFVGVQELLAGDPVTCLLTPWPQKTLS